MFLARQAVASGAADCVLALGFEQMSPGALGATFKDRPSPFERFDSATDELVDAELPLALRYFGGAGLAHMNEFGTRVETFAKIRAKASRHAANNPLALFRSIVTEEEVMASTTIWPGVMTRLMACPPTCGSAAAIICSGEFARKHGLQQNVRIRAQAMTTDTPVTFEARDMREVVGFSMAQSAARQVYEAAGVGPQDIDVVELHDCFAHNELISYEALGLCGEGEAPKLIDNNDTTYGGRWVVNPSGGLISKGHPLGATGLAQCAELTWQLRGTADKRQVDGARLGLTHVLGLGTAQNATSTSVPSFGALLIAKRAWFASASAFVNSESISTRGRLLASSSAFFIEAAAKTVMVFSCARARGGPAIVMKVMAAVMAVMVGTVSMVAAISTAAASVFTVAPYTPVDTTAGAGIVG